MSTDRLLKHVFFLVSFFGCFLCHTEMSCRLDTISEQKKNTEARDEQEEEEEVAVFTFMPF